MPVTNISAALTAAQVTAINGALNTIRTNLPFLVNLTAEERLALSKMGEIGYNYVTRALDYAQGNAGILPPNFNLTEAQKDLKLVNDIRPIMQQVAQLLEAIDDTMMMAGIEAKDFADKFYALAKLQAGTNTPGMDVIVSDLATFYEKSSESTPTPPNE
jgi:hypothetical protein